MCEAASSAVLKRWQIKTHQNSGQALLSTVNFGSATDPIRDETQPGRGGSERKASTRALTERTLQEGDKLLFPGAGQRESSLGWRAGEA